MMAHRMQTVIFIWVRCKLPCGFIVSDIFQGHALNKILKDIINRYHVLLGHRIQ